MDILKPLIEESGIRTETFSQPKIALEQLTNPSAVSAVLVDFAMPEMTGLDVLKEIYKRDPDLPVLYLSGALEKRALIQSVELGLFAALEKPFKHDHLLSQIHSAIRLREISKTLKRSVNLLLYQFSDLAKYLEKQGKSDILKYVRNEMNLIIESKRALRNTIKERGNETA